MAEHMKIAPLDATFGAVVTGITLATLDEAAFAALYKTWLDYALLIFPGQHLTREQQIAFAKRFGALEFAIAPISNVKADGTLRGEDDDDVVKVLKGNMFWHADSTYMPVQAKGAVFSAEIVPPSGGETGWADMRAAYDALDDAMRAKVERLDAAHSL
ncbi:MAG: TauD/TfdA family dioxygenase, partial [Alphaproteobacteria bacterium]|nr:TauD/TfdA family dioxygenase [Alphaproteobacteria bacterium]